MKDDDVKLHNKVKIISKYNCKLEESLIYKRMIEKNQSYAYVTTIYSEHVPIIYVLSDEDGNDGDFFHISDFVDYIKEDRKIKLKNIFDNYER